ncbi:hypothetical protein LTR56_026619 [Elasticomyces elasticus]|nr:hypothetical protein LTR56_026619 [Elasticomyces elasticus]
MGMGCGLEDFCDRGNKRLLCKGVDFRAGDSTVSKFLDYAKLCIEDHREHCDKINGWFGDENQARGFTFTCDESRRWFLTLHHDEGHLSAALAGGKKKIKGLKRQTKRLAARKDKRLENKTVEGKGGSIRDEHWAAGSRCEEVERGGQCCSSVKVNRDEKRAMNVIDVPMEGTHSEEKVVRAVHRLDNAPLKR